MKFIYTILFIALFCSCEKESAKILPSEYLNKNQIEAFKYDIIRYSDKLPKKATNETKFDTKFDSIYKLKAKNADLYYYYVDNSTKDIYFAIATIAPSLKVKKVVTAAKLTKDKDGNISYYKEIFRTWKMEIPELKTKSKQLFIDFIDGKDLSQFYTKNSKGEFFIEFPDDYTKYDTESRKWITINPN